MWYYDRQGIIQVGGFNFVQDLPRFLVLLYALQRFELSDWGRNPAFTVHESPAGDKIEKHTVVLKESFTFTLHPSNSRRLAMKGRATAVMEVSCDKLLHKGSMVAKLYWAEETRISEVDILKKVKQAEKNIVVKGHVPDLLFEYKFPLSTATVRQKLDFDKTSTVTSKGSRTFWFLVFPKLQPIKELQGNELFSAWRQCVLCKFNCLLLFLVLKVTSFKVITPFGRRGSIIETLVVKT